MELSAQAAARFPAAARHCCFSRAENQPVAGDTRSLARDIGLRTENHALGSPTKQWNGRGLRTHDQA